MKKIIQKKNHIIVNFELYLWKKLILDENKV